MVLKNKKAPLVAGAFFAVFAAPASAFPIPTVPTWAVEGWSGGLEVGMVLASGNSPERTITGRGDITRDWADWRQNVLFTSRYTEVDDSRTAERYQISTQLDYKFNPHDYVFIRARYDDDSFSGFDFQASTAVGYGRRVWQELENFFDVSVGGGYRYNRFRVPDPDTGATSTEEPIGRLAAKFNYQFSPTASFRQDLETEVGLDDGESISQAISSIQANLMGSLAMRLSYTIEHESEVPAGTKNTDTITSVTLLYSF